MSHEHEHDEALMRIATMGAGMAAGWLTNHLVAIIWKAVTGHSAPRDLDSDDLKIVQAVAFAAVSGGVAVLVNRLLSKGAVHVVAGLGSHHAEA